MRELLTLEDYAAELLRLVVPDTRAGELLPLGDAQGRVLAAPVSSAVAVPGFDNSAMDGYAVRHADVASVPALLRVVGEVAAGSASDPHAGPRECVRIMTGAALPSFADTVVAVEQTDGGTERVEVREAPARPGQHVRRTGGDVSPGDLIAAPGAVLGPGLLGAIAAVGVSVVTVRSRPVVAVGVTGDELVTGSAPLGRGQLYESNSPVLAACLRRDGATVVRGEPLNDRAEALVAWLDGVTAGGEADLVVLTGGASVGAYDVVRDVLTAAGGTFRHVRVQPGKPQGWAVWQGVPVVSLPGNPLSAALSYEVFVRPMLDRLVGRGSPRWYTAVAGADWRSPAGRRQLVPVRVSAGEAGSLVAVPAHERGSASHMVTSLAAADGFVMVPEEITEVTAGQVLAMRWL